MPDDIRELCQDIATAEARKHREQYPDYKYSPRARTDRRPPTAAKPKSRGRKKAADDDADDDYVGHGLELYLPERPTLRARSRRTVVVDEDDEYEEEEDMTVAAESDASSVSGATAVSNYSDSDRGSTATAPASPSPTTSSLSLSEPVSACTPATTVLAEEGADAFADKINPDLMSWSFGMPTPRLACAFLSRVFLVVAGTSLRQLDGR
ncbi:hypothetical protein AURDEDRAFT_116099 [Auricularia subglabra TFB-10046 SS5]|uniref:Uncharacterized protein n=1 Tax=Auricularia subglabra (strain TFB-10046 / SS5) TaxID=717982 RepID=J0D1C7_AURST|nr:hypothetical protein AURDEDRAFT_116099 [Auricularia subglabra TFB-10046 SS5]